jgi:two-component system chemotaxis response regulator CheY
MNKNEALLVIDTDSGSARASKETLARLCTNKIFIAETVSTALDIIEKNDVVFIIIHLLYKKDESIDLIKRIRTDKDSIKYKVPILVLIENEKNISKEEIINAGASECIIQPLSSNELQENIINIINNPKIFIECDNYIGPDRRKELKKVENEKRNIR